MKPWCPGATFKTDSTGDQGCFSVSALTKTAAMGAENRCFGEEMAVFTGFFVAFFLTGDQG